MGDMMILNFDESGNFGRSGRYFVIACIGAQNMKPLENVMDKVILKIKKEFPQYARAREIKANHAFPVIKDFMLRKISSKEVDIRYIVADLHHVKKSLRDDENLLYNYMLHYLIAPVARKNAVKCLELNLDKRTIKVKSTNSFEDYIKIKLNYEMNLGVKVNVNYIESHNSYSIQAADFIANAIYGKYEHGQDQLYNLLSAKIVHRELFPHRLFGTDKVVNIGNMGV